METRSMARKRRSRQGEKEEVRKVDFINNLPDDCLSHIFSFLDIENKLRTTGVCKRWKDFGSESWRNVKKLDLINLKELTTEHSRIISLCGKFLEELSMPIPSKSNIIKVAASSCENLIKLRTRFEYYGADKDKEVHGQDLAQLFKGNTGLRSLAMEHLNRDFSHCIHCFFELTEDLVELELWGYRQHEQLAYKYAVTPLSPFDPIMRRFKKLETLELNNFCLYEDDLKLIEAFQELRSLKIHTTNNYNAYNIDSILKLRKLESLSLCNNKRIYEHWLRTLARNNPGMKHLRLEGLPMSGDQNGGLEEFSKLETLQLLRVYGDVGSTSLNTLHHLKEFICDSVGTSEIIRLLDVAPELQFVNLTGAWIGPRVLDEAHEVCKGRTNHIALHMIVEGNIIANWKKPRVMCPLFILESARDYIKRTDWRYKDIDEETMYFPYL